MAARGMPPKKAKDKGPPPVAKATVEVDAGELQQQAYVRQSLQANIAALKERLKALGDDNEGLRKTRAKVRRGAVQCGCVPRRAPARNL